jgi:hypothetical protein
MQQHFLIEVESKGDITEKKRKTLKTKMDAVKAKLNILIDKLDNIHNSAENEAIYSKLSFSELEVLGEKYEYHISS